MRHLLTTIALTAAIALGACGGEEAAAPGDRAPVDVEDQLGFDDAGIIARQSRVETAIRDCMRAEGFEYVPVDPLAQREAINSQLREREVKVQEAGVPLTQAKTQRERKELEALEGVPAAEPGGPGPS